jgi:hypothetical protein
LGIEIMSKQIANEESDWIEDEFAKLDLGDARLSNRVKEILRQWSSQPTASIPLACGGRAEMEAAYRLLDNENAPWHKIAEPHWAETEKRASANPVVLCLTDNTELDFNGQKAEGLGPLNYEARRGMYMHPTYLVTPERLPLGVTNLCMWAREFRDKDGVRPGQRESRRWVEAYENLAEMADRLGDGTRLVYVADRESDMIELMWRAKELGEPVDWLVRAKHNRRCLVDDGGGNLLDRDHDTERAEAEVAQLWPLTTSGEPIGEITFTLPARGKTKPRPVHQHLWVKRVNISAGKGKTLAVTCIVAREINAPKGSEPVEWRLLTNREANTGAEVVELIDWYRARWEIEIFFNVLKNGCKVESMQLKAIERIERALTLYTVVAWRVIFLMRIGRTCPDLDATLFFHPDEIKGAHLLSKTPLPKTVLPLQQMMRVVAKLGGFLGRKSDGEPGVKAIWLGLQRTMDAASTIQALRELQE